MIFSNELSQTLEVATARVYNWDVTMRRKEKAEVEDTPNARGKGPPDS